MTRTFIRITAEDGSFLEDCDPLYLQAIPRVGEELTGQHGLLTVTEVSYHIEDDQIHHVNLTCRVQEDTEHH